MSGRQIMTADEIRRATIRLSHEIVEKQAGTDGPAPDRHPASRRAARPADRRRDRRERGRRGPGRRARHHLLPRRPVDGRPAAGRQGHGPAVRGSTAGRSCSSTTSCTPAGRSAPRWTRSSTSGGRRRSGWPSSSIAAIASCRSGPTTSARTSRPRARSWSGSTSRRSTARTASRSSGRRRARRRAGRVSVRSTRDRRPRSVAGDRPTSASRRSTPRPRSQPVAWRHRHLLDVDGLSAADLELVMRTTDAMREVLARPIAKVPALRGRQVTILFYEASTRTRVSFEVAAKNLSADVVNIAAASSSVSKGESLVDTVRTVEALGAQMLVMRHSVSGAPYLAAEIFGGLGPQRRRRLARPSDPGAARPVHDARAAARRVAGRAQGRDPRRPAPLARGALQHLDADRGRRRPVAVRPGDAPPRVRGVGRPRARRPGAGSTSRPRSTRRCATPTSSWPCGSSASGWPPACCRRCASTRRATG